jgi:hypothetical protein
MGSANPIVETTITVVVLTITVAAITAVALTITVVVLTITAVVLTITDDPTGGVTAGTTDISERYRAGMTMSALGIRDLAGQGRRSYLSAVTPIAGKRGYG